MNKEAFLAHLEDMRLNAGRMFIESHDVWHECEMHVTEYLIRVIKQGGFDK